MIDKAKNILKKIKLKTIKAIKTKDTLKAKIDEIKTAIEDEPNKEMFRFLLEQFKLLLHEIKPVKQDINIHYGCEDPYITGKNPCLCLNILRIYRHRYEYNPGF